MGKIETMGTSSHAESYNKMTDSQGNNLRNISGWDFEVKVRKRKCTYNVILRCVLAIIVVVEEQ